MSRVVLILPLLGIWCAAIAAGQPTCRNNVAALDTQFQAAVKRNDAAIVSRLLPSDYILISSTGEVATKADLVNEALQRKYIYIHQEDTRQTVRIWGGTAVLTALLWAQGKTEGRHFNLKIWFSDTYACTPQGWRYVFGQVGARIPVK